jgi:hypothetical protein
MEESSPLVSELLALAVVFGHLRVVLAAALPVVVVSGPPFSRTIAATLAVFAVGDETAPVIIAAASPLACRIGAHNLPGPELRGLECPLAIPAAAFFHKARFRRSQSPLLI